MEQASNLERNQLWRRQQADARRDAWATSARGVTPPLVKRKTERRAEQRRRQSLRASAASQSAGGGDDLARRGGAGCQAQTHRCPIHGRRRCTRRRTW